MSLSGLFDIQSPPDLLRGLLNTLSEYEQNREEGERPKMGVSKLVLLLICSTECSLALIQ
jgi:hypothetical protein